MAIKLALGCGLICLIFFAGWTVNGWRLRGEIEELEGLYAEAMKSNQSFVVALHNRDRVLAEQSARIKELAANTDIAQEKMRRLTDQLAKTNAEYYNLKSALINQPLPVECKDAVIETMIRLKNLTNGGN